MIEWSDGDLLAADTEALVNAVNTVGVMGKGLALQVKRAFPDNFTAYRRACETGEVTSGRVLVHDNGHAGPRRYVLNVPTKRHWRSRSRLEDVQAGLAALVGAVRDLGVDSVAIPALGCGEGGLAWDAVLPLIERAAEGMPHVRVVVHPPR